MYQFNNTTVLNYLQRITFCYEKGAYNIIDGLTKLIKEHNLQNKVSIKTTFFVENCNNVDYIFNKYNFSKYIETGLIT
ncbi:MAG TPA: hypothetical protein DDW90_02190 [Cyanobacteria bacterium UBA9971]|nr:hypothetical protein [Cyanobacteria bacterium UBA9971]